MALGPKCYFCDSASFAIRQSKNISGHKLLIYCDACGQMMGIISVENHPQFSLHSIMQVITEGVSNVGK